VGKTADYSFVSDDVSVLRGKKFGVVGTKQFRERMRTALEELGASLFSLCSMDIRQTEQADEIEEALKQIEDYSWIAFTSANSIKIFFERAKKIHFDFRNFAKVKFAVVGSGTRDVLSKYGFEADYLPEHYTTKALAEGLSEILKKDDKLLIPRALRGNEEMLKVLDAAGRNYKVISVYDVVGMRTDNWQYLDEFDVITFASGSGAEAFVKEIEKDMDISYWEENRKKNGIRIATIGDMTARALLKHGITADIVPKQCDSINLIKAIKEYYEKYSDSKDIYSIGMRK
jgi:uroporphyrinogen III methyltransferase/synthase